MKFSDRDLYHIPAWFKFLRCSTLLHKEAINRISQAAVAGLHSLGLPSCTLLVEPQAPHLTQSVEETSSRATFCSAAPGQELIVRILAMCNDMMLILAARASRIIQSNIHSFYSVNIIPKVVEKPKSSQLKLLGYQSPKSKPSISWIPVRCLMLRKAPALNQCSLLPHRLQPHLCKSC